MLDGRAKIEKQHKEGSVISSDNVCRVHLSLFFPQLNPALLVQNAECRLKGIEFRNQNSEIQWGLGENIH